MSTVVTALMDSTTGLSAAKIVAPLADMVPFYVMIIPVALGIRFFRRGVNSLGNKGKVRA